MHSRGDMDLFRIGRLHRVGMAALAALGWATAAEAIDTKAVLDAVGFPPDTEARVRAGEFVETSLPATSERDLNVGIAFLIAKPPAEVMQKLREGPLLPKVDPDTHAYGVLEGDGTAAELAELKLTPAQLQAYAAAQPGDALNLSGEEIAALAAAGKDEAAIQRVVRDQLLARHRAYRAQGLAGMAPYARDKGASEPAAAFRANNELVRSSKLLPPAFADLLDAYPKDAPADLEEVFSWSLFTAHGVDTIALAHVMHTSVAGSPVAVQRHYYVSSGYNAEQALAAFQPVPEGTLVIYTNHTSTDQLAGLGSGAKRSVGRKILAGQLQSLFEKARAEIGGSAAR